MTRIKIQSADTNLIVINVRRYFREFYIDSETMSMIRNIKIIGSQNNK